MQRGDGVTLEKAGPGTQCDWCSPRKRRRDTEKETGGEEGHVTVGAEMGLKTPGAKELQGSPVAAP